MSIQYSRGCPFNCDFCDIIILNGRVPRSKGSDQVLGELDALYDRGWRGGVFIVDDNFIGNKQKVKRLLPDLRHWNQERKYPFHFITEASLNLADDDELMKMMADANFSQVFLGIETPNEGSLTECNKTQNSERDMADSIRKIQQAGLEVMGGFIVGFDNDPPSIFEQQIRFIQRIGVVTAMVGLLHAVPRTPLYQRLKQQGRILMNSTGNNTDGTLNFIPKMDTQLLVTAPRNHQHHLCSEAILRTGSDLPQGLPAQVEGSPPYLKGYPGLREIHFHTGYFCQRAELLLEAPDRHFVQKQKSASSGPLLCHLWLPFPPGIEASFYFTPEGSCPRLPLTSS